MQGPLTVRAFAGVLAASCVPLLALGAVLGTFVSILMERMALTGHVHALLAGERHATPRAGPRRICGAHALHAPCMCGHDDLQPALLASGLQRYSLVAPPHVAVMCAWRDVAWFGLWLAGCRPGHQRPGGLGGAGLQLHRAAAHHGLRAGAPAPRGACMGLCMHACMRADDLLSHRVCVLGRAGRARQPAQWNSHSQAGRQAPFPPSRHAGLQTLCCGWTIPAAPDQARGAAACSRAARFVPPCHACP